jgi:hypothetical protein
MVIGYRLLFIEGVSGFSGFNGVVSGDAAASLNFKL